ncbi:MAG: hypothetical protein IPH44_17445 [Myxococcales bacterium]|nr:hypothetical protein [Myxococcales bacterium]MBK7196690.1 hypothetical protein [Myxococcales bacterium]MBP6845177.1 hypothetical protein [Kofleriaceae bacterium]
MSDAPFRGTADPLGPRLHRFVIPRPPPAPNVRTPYAVAASVLSALGAVTGQLSMAVAFGAIGVVGVVDRIKGHRTVQPTTNADVHERGLRVIADVAWADVLVVTIDGTADQGPAPATLTIATRDATTAIVGHADDLGPLVTAIAAGVGPRQRREAEARLIEGHPLTYGRHQLTSYGLMTRDAGVPWRDLGPTRRARGQLVIDSPIGELTTPIGGVHNPWVIERLVAERGRPAT